MSTFAWLRRRRAAEPPLDGSAESSGGNAAPELHADEAESDPVVAGERSTAAVNRPASLQSRVSNALAAGLLGAMTLGLIGWYYVHSFAGGSTDRMKARTSAADKARGEMVLPPLGRIDPPGAPSSAAAAILGPPPEVPGLVDVLEDAESPSAASALLSEPSNSYAPAAYAQARTITPEAAALARKLAGVVFARQGTGTSSPVRAAALDAGAAVDSPVGADASSSFAGASLASRVRDTDGDLHALFTPTETPAVSANVLPEQTLLLPKGAFVDCTLETAIDSTLPGMTTCVTATDTFGADGHVVLLERGTKLVGETRGQVRHGSARIFVLWTEARTPTGVVVPLASPGTDELGRSGLAGEVDRHFMERFGAAILISVIDGAIQAVVQSQQDGGDSTVIYSPSTARDIMTEVLRSTVDIPPTVVKPQGDRIQILVARDLDFRSVYELRSVARR